jgi:hypothetical protein
MAKHFIFVLYFMTGESLYSSFFYAPEAHIMYLTVVSWFLISFVMGEGGRGPSRANKFFYAPAPPPPSVWALKPPSWALVHKPPMYLWLYSSVHNVLDACISITWASGRGMALEFYWVPNGTRLSARSHFTGPKKLSRIPGPNPLPLAQVMDMHTSKTFCTGL